MLLHPETNLERSPVVLGAAIIEILKKDKRQMLIDNLLTSFLKSDNKRTPDLFLEALIFLYSIGAIERKHYKIVLKESSNA
jgi:hypothetical protein